eukprot:scaffold2450_cov401-Prasinococcus_capsulatus_cf.AAC.13
MAPHGRPCGVHPRTPAVDTSLGLLPLRALAPAWRVPTAVSALGEAKYEVGWATPCPSVSLPRERRCLVRLPAAQAPLETSTASKGRFRSDRQRGSMQSTRAPSEARAPSDGDGKTKTGRWTAPAHRGRARVGKPVTHAVGQGGAEEVRWIQVRSGKGMGGGCGGDGWMGLAGPSDGIIDTYRFHIGTYVCMSVCANRGGHVDWFGSLGTGNQPAEGGGQPPTPHDHAAHYAYSTGGCIPPLAPGPASESAPTPFCREDILGTLAANVGPSIKPPCSSRGIVACRVRGGCPATCQGTEWRKPSRVTSRVPVPGTEDTTAATGPADWHAWVG